MPWWWGYTETVSPSPPRLHRISTRLIPTTFAAAPPQGTPAMNDVLRQLFNR
jgi:hypothetical protein